MRSITLNDIAGYVTASNACELLAVLSGGEYKGCLAQIKASDIRVEGGFAIDIKPKNTTTSNEADEVWCVGALAFYAVMGVEAFEGRGMKWQTAEMPVPRIPLSAADAELSGLIYRCLNHDSAQRPTMNELNNLAKTLRQKAQSRKRADRRRKTLTAASGRSYEESLVKFWPEEMILTLLLFLSFIYPCDLFSQNGTKGKHPAELTAIVNRCKSLRSSANVKRVTSEFENDMQWTLLDEIAIDRKGECTTKDPVKMFGVNSIAARILKYQSGAVNMGGRFRNGQDPRYKYSFIEVTVKKGATVSYEITKREGTQTFAVVPYAADASFSVEVKQSQHRIGTPEMNDGVCYVSTHKRLLPTDKFTISIENKSGKNMAFVIVNYNSRN